MPRLIRQLVAAALLVVPLAASAAFEACLDQFPNRQVPVVQTQGLQARDICFDSFAVLHSGKTKTPIYVVERLNKERLLDGKDLKRCSRAYEEARLPSKERASLSDYKGSGYDRGHMAPARDMPNQNAMEQSCSLANMVPQAPKHNQGPWNKIEQDTRKYVMHHADGDVYVFTGPWYSGSEQAIGYGKVKIPSVIWKLVYDAQTGRSWVHWSENIDGERVKEPISLQEFTARTGLELVRER